MIVDSTDPAVPRILASIELADQPSYLEVVGDVAFITSNEGGGLRMFDVANPANPRLIGSFPGDFERLKVLDGAAYVAGEGIKIIDVADPANPRLLGETDVPGQIRGIDVTAEGIVLLTTYHNRLVIIDASDPTNIHLISTLRTPNLPTGLQVRDDVVFVAVGDATNNDFHGLMAFDITDPSDPQSLGMSRANSRPYSIRIMDDTAYVGEANLGMSVWDVADPSNMSIDGVITTPETPGRASVTPDEIACIPVGRFGMRYIDVSDSENLTVVGRLVLPSEARDIDIADNVMCVTSGETYAPTNLFDISDPTQPQYISSIWEPNWPTFRDVVLDGGFGYFAAYDSGLWVYDLSDTRNPFRTAIVNPTRGNSVAVAISGDYLLHGTNDGLQILDIQDPIDPIEVGWIALEGTVRGLDISGNLAAHSRGSEIYLVDISDPTNPILINTITDFRFLQHVDVDGNLAFVAAEESTILDIKDPMNPVVLGSLASSGGRGYAIKSIGGYVLLTTGSGLNLFDVRDPAHPVLLGWTGAGEANLEFAVRGSVAYVAGREIGVQIVDIAECIGDCLALSVENLTGGDVARIKVEGGAVGARGAVMWGTGGEPTRIINLDGWCANFGFTLPINNASRRTVGVGSFDANGELTFERLVPANSIGMELMFQAAERGTCPGECMSNLVIETVK